MRITNLIPNCKSVPRALRLGAALLLAFAVGGALPLHGQATYGAYSIGVFRQNLPGYAPYAVWIVDSNGSHAWEGTDSANWFGLNGDIPVMGDWNFTGTRGLGVFRSGYWYVDTNNDGVWSPGNPTTDDQVFSFGLPGDQPFTINSSADNFLHLAVFRQSTDPNSGTVQGLVIVDPTQCNCWSALSQVSTIYNSQLGDLPVMVNPDGQGGRLAFYRPSTGAWYIGPLAASGNLTFDLNSVMPQQFGSPGGLPVAGDWTSTNSPVWHIGVYRGEQGMWNVDSDGNNAQDGGDAVYYYGLSGDIPVMGPWAGTTVTTRPPGLQATIDYGTTCTSSPCSYPWTLGSYHYIGVNSPQAGVTFTGWSDGGAQTHGVSVQYWSPAIYTAYFASPLTVTTTSPLIGGTVGTYYSQTLSATGGTSPYYWSVANGSTLPAGLSLSYYTGVLSGTPSTAPGYPYYFTIQVNDSAGGSATRQFSLTVSPSAISVSVTPSSPPNLQAGGTQQFNATVTGTSSTGVTWSRSPALGTISNSGLYTAPTIVASNTTVTITATSQADPTRQGTATITVLVNPLPLPDPLKGINYFPRGHAWWSMLYDWYTQDCDTSTEPSSCKPGKRVADVVASDLQNLNPFNFIHLYLWDQDIIQDSQQNGALVTNLAAPGFVGWDNGNPQTSPANSRGPNDSTHNQWTALAEFASLAKQNNLWLMVEFAVGRPGREANLRACGHTTCPPNINGCPYPPTGWQYSANSTCPATYNCTGFTNASLGCSYAAWVSSFIDYLAPYQNVLIWGASYGIPFGVADNFWQTSCPASGQGAYQQIMSHLQQNPYTSPAPAGRALLSLDIDFASALGPPYQGPTCPVYPIPITTGTDPQLGFYTSNWQGMQQTAYTWQTSLPAGVPPPDIYAPQLWNANAGDLQAALECVAGIVNNTTCPATVQACSLATGQCPIPASKMIVTEFGTGSSLEAGPVGNRTASFGDDQTPTTTANGQAQWITQTLCAMNRVGVRNTGYFGLYDSYSWWASTFDYDAPTLAWDGFWGLKSEATSYNPNYDGQKPAWTALTTFPNIIPGNPTSPGVCAQVPPTPVIAILPPDGGVPTSGANPYYTIGDTANVFYTAANVTSLTMSATPGNIPASSSWACDVANTLLSNGPSLVGSCGYAQFSVMANTGTGAFTLSGSNADADHATSITPTSATPVSTLVTVGPAPIVTGLVDSNNTSQQCNLTTNPGCMLTVSQLDTIEVFGAGFNPTGGNTIQLVNQSGQQTLSVGDSYYFWDASRTQINVQIGCFVPPGAWTLHVSSPNPGSVPSAGASITVNAGAGC